MGKKSEIVALSFGALMKLRAISVNTSVRLRKWFPLSPSNFDYFRNVELTTHTERSIKSGFHKLLSV